MTCMTFPHAAHHRVRPLTFGLFTDCLCRIEAACCQIIFDTCYRLTGQRGREVGLLVQRASWMCFDKKTRRAQTTTHEEAKSAVSLWLCFDAV